jgi:hypothetical protein
VIRTIDYSVTNKTGNVNTLTRYMLAKTLSMFEWENLPLTIPKKELEKQLQVNGYTFITEINGELYALTGGLGGETDVYGNPTEITINNVALNFNKTLSIKDDGILIFNDDMEMGLIPLFTRYFSQIVENDINLSMLGISSRTPILLTASDTKTKASLDLFLKKLIDGEFSVIGENPIFEGVRALNLNGNNTSTFNALIEYNQYLKGSLYNEIGINANSVMKRERLSNEEVKANDDTLFPFIYNMLANRLQSVERLNEKYGLNLAVDFGSIWKVKAIEKIDNIVSRETDNEPTNEPTNEPINEPINEPNNEPLNEPLKEPINEPINEPQNEPSTDSTKDRIDDYLTETTLAEIEQAKEMLADETLSEDDRAELLTIIEDLEKGLQNAIDE